jgi:hypothetical protein
MSIVSCITAKKYTNYRKIHVFEIETGMNEIFFNVLKSLKLFCSIRIHERTSPPDSVQAHILLIGRAHSVDKNPKRSHAIRPFFSRYALLNFQRITKYY